MDNITHSLTGVLAGRLLRRKGHSENGAGDAGQERTLFWLSILAVNFPDIDVVANFFVDPLTSLHTHRGITHSLVIAPIFALIPAGVVMIFTRSVAFRTLWGTAVVCIAVHIFFDLITAFGTQIFYPVSETRYAFDWMFIVDPVFTLALLAMTIAGRYMKRRRAALRYITAGFTTAYLLAGIWMQSRAMEKFTELIAAPVDAAVRMDPGRGGRVEIFEAAALPQPFALTRWVGLARTDSGLVRAFVNAFDGDAGFRKEEFVNARDGFVDSAMTTSHVADYLRFARYPFVTSEPDGDGRIVEFRDYQFSVDPWIIEAFGAGERDVPFVLRLKYDAGARLVSVLFNDRPVPLQR